MLSNISCSRFFVFHILLLYVFSFNRVYAHVEKTNLEQKQLLVPVGVVLDLNSTFGAMVNLCMDMAISEFYSSHSNYKTRLQLHKKDAKSALDVNFAVLDLVKHEEVLAILGPQGSTGETYAAAVGETVHVPIVSFTARSSALSYTENRYFVRTTFDDTVQVQALAAICQTYEWDEVVILYEETAYGSHFLSHLINAFQDVDIGVTYTTSIPTSAEDSHILKELNKTNAKQTKVFLVHTMNPGLGSRLFALANSAGMMSEGYAWIISDSLSIFLNSMDSEARDSMDGVLGIRPHVMNSFHERWKRNMLLNKNTDHIMELNIFGLWAYDAVTALAIAVENVKPVDSSLLHVDGTDKTGLRISSFGPKLINELPNTKFRGLAGDFQLVEGKLEHPAFEIFNVVGNGERRVGFWTPDRGLIRELSASASSKQLKKVVWPGDSVRQPKGWGSLRVGIPWKPGFKEFVNVTINPTTNETLVSGFSIDIFWEALKELRFPINYTFHCYNDSGSANWSYDSMLHKIPQEYDMVVADTTIWAPRASYVDFSLPYAGSDVVLVVQNKKTFDMWIFIRPLRWDLWLALIMACILMGVALRILERRVDRTGDEPGRPHAARSGAIYWSPVSILAFQDRDMVSNKWSVFVLVCWLFMSFIIMQSFTANLSAILTVDQLTFAFSEDYHIGYHTGSFMKTFLMDQLHIKESRLKPYATPREFHDAMTRGSKNGGIDAIFDEIPYMKLFLNRYGSRYKIVGPSYRTDGLGFAFPRGSPLVAYFSRAILNVTQGPEMNNLERKNFGPGYSSQDPLSSVISQGTSSLTLHEFLGLFLVTGALVLFALFCSETAIGRKLSDMTEYVVQHCFSFRNLRVHSMEGLRDVGDTTPVGGDRSLELAHNKVDTPPPPPGEGGGAEFVGGETQQDAEEIAETGLNNEANAAQDAGVGTENQEMRNS